MKPCRQCARQCQTLYRGLCRRCDSAALEAKIGPGVRIWHPTNASDEEIVDGLIRLRKEKLRRANWCHDDDRETEMRVREQMALLNDPALMDFQE